MVLASKPVIAFNSLATATTPMNYPLDHFIEALREELKQYGEMLALIVEKPSKAWTSLEQRRINDFFQRIRDRSANKRGQRWGYLTTPFERAIAPRLGTARASNLP